MGKWLVLELGNTYQVSTLFKRTDSYLPVIMLNNLGIFIDAHLISMLEILSILKRVVFTRNNISISVKELIIKVS